jgi:hypothetical protein
MKYIYYVLASFGMWLARRFGNVRPGDEPSHGERIERPGAYFEVRTKDDQYVGFFFCDYYRRADDGPYHMYLGDNLVAGLSSNLIVLAEGPEPEKKYVVAEAREGQ